jgi:hypothetical protein
MAYGDWPKSRDDTVDFGDEWEEGISISQFAFHNLYNKSVLLATRGYGFLTNGNFWVLRDVVWQLTRVTCKDRHMVFSFQSCLDDGYTQGASSTKDKGLLPGRHFGD